jgi:C4-dicarboxylate transporter DctM subunit
VSPEAIGGIGFGVVFLLLAFGVRIGFALALVGFAGIAIIANMKGALINLATSPFSTVATYIFITVPLFLLMGALANAAGIGTDAYSVGNKWLGRLPGGLAMGTIAGCAAFGACSGSSGGAISVFGLTAFPEMKRYNYADTLAAGCIAAGTPLAILIPPSMAMIVYGLMSETSIGALFIAGILPGILLSLLFIIGILIWVKLRPEVGPRGPKTTWRERLVSLKDVWSVVLLGGLVLGGIWGGVFTPVEAAGIGSFGAFVIAISRRRLNKQVLSQALSDTTRLSGMIFVIMIGAIIFNVFLALSGLPTMLAEFVQGLPVPRVLILVTVLLFYLVGGCLMDVIGMILLTLPIFVPIMIGLNYDLILFGVLVTIMSEMAVITPPIGMNVFVLAGILKDVPMYTIFRGIIPFIFCEMACIAIIIAFPDIALFLPHTMMGS